MNGINRRQRGCSARLRLPALIVALVMIGTSPSLAQVRQTTLEELRRELSPGDFISVVQTSGESVSGRFVGFGDTALDIHSDIRSATGKERLDIAVPLATIKSLDRPRDSSRNGLRIGASVGGGISLGMFVYAAAVDSNEIGEWAPMYLAMGALYTGVGALVGWAIDSAHSKPHVRFNAPSAETMSIRSSSDPRTPQGHGGRHGFLTTPGPATSAGEKPVNADRRRIEFLAAGAS